MTLLAFVNLIALAMLFKIGLRLLNDYDAQRKAGIDTPVFDSSQFPDLDLDFTAWPKPGHQQPAATPAPSRGKAVVDTP
jgi:AGCS family alanine or glycine:cation symporter